MPRIRSIKPEFWTDRKLARLSRDARLLYISLWNHADEHGRLHGDERFIKGHCMPYEDDLTLDDIGVLLDELRSHGRVVRYVVEGDPFLYLPKLRTHQRLEPQKTDSRLPEPPSERESEVRADNPEKIPDSSGEIVAQQVAGSRVHVAGKNPSSPRSIDGEPPGFADWYDAYPRKQARGDAAKAYRKALKQTTADVLLAAVVRFRDDPNLPADRRFVPHPATWLNRGSWADEPLPAPGPKPWERIPAGQEHLPEHERFRPVNVWA